ncbi:Uncharacterised protein [Klebsiella pneumoniae]|nr:Uncharacterised protein [Klebsiella pneumoniae]
MQSVQLTILLISALVLGCMVALSLLKVRMMSWLNMPTRLQVNIFQANSKLKCQNSELNHLNLKKKLNFQVQRVIT